MKKLLIFVFAFGLMLSCSKEEKNTMFVKGDIQGLRKGTFYLQKQVDSLIVTIDSVSINGKSDFLLTDIVDSPEMYYLAMADSDKKIPFFGEKDTVYITTSLDKFNFKYLIRGSENQDVLDEYYSFIKKFNDQNLDLQKALIETRMRGALDSVPVLEKRKNDLLRRKYLYSINYAINHSDKEAAPYLAMTELVNANTKWLDSIYNSLTPQVRSSKYGEELKNFIVRIKVAEE